MHPAGGAPGMMGWGPVHWALHALGLRAANMELTQAEQDCVMRHAAGKRSLVQVGVMHGATTALLRRVMDPDGMITGIDPHPAGLFGVSFERWIAVRELARYRRGRAVLLRQPSREAAARWTTPIDFLFIDGDHSWAGIDGDWRCWSGFVMPGGVVGLHDSLSVPIRPDADSVRYTREVILRDRRFRAIDAAESVTVLERVAG